MERRIQEDFVTKQMRAEELRLEHLDEKRRKAQEEDEKKKEIQFIQRLEGTNARLELEDRLRSKEQRVEQLEQDRQRRNAEKAAKEKAVLARREANEQERLRQVQALLDERSELQRRGTKKLDAGGQAPDLTVHGTALSAPASNDDPCDPETKRRLASLKKRLKKVKQRMAKRAHSELDEPHPELDQKAQRLFSRLLAAVESRAGEKTVNRAVSDCVVWLFKNTVSSNAAGYVCSVLILVLNAPSAVVTQHSRLQASTGLCKLLAGLDNPALWAVSRSLLYANRTTVLFEALGASWLCPDAELTSRLCWVAASIVQPLSSAGVGQGDSPTDHGQWLDDLSSFIVCTGHLDSIRDRFLQHHMTVCPVFVCVTPAFSATDLSLPNALPLDLSSSMFTSTRPSHASEPPSHGRNNWRLVCALQDGGWCSAGHHREVGRPDAGHLLHPAPPGLWLQRHWPLAGPGGDGTAW